VESLLGILSEQDVEHHFLFLNRVFQNPLLLVPQQQQQQENQEEEEKIDKQVPGANPNFDTIRLWVVDQIYLVLKTPKIKKSKRIVEESIEWLVSTAFSEWKGMESTSNTNGCELVRKSCREKLVTSLSYLSHLSFSKEEGEKDGEKLGKEGHEMKPGYYTPTQTWLSLIHSLLMKSKSNDSALLLKSSESIHRIIDEKPNVSVSSLLSLSELDCFQKVFETLGIVFYCDIDVDEKSEEKGVQIISELDQCVSNMITQPCLPNRKRKQDGIEKGDDSEGGGIESIQAVEVLVDLLISFLARPSVVFRSLSVDVFKTFAKKTATRSVLDLFIEVISFFLC
jgi:DNA polymerase phi